MFFLRIQQQGGFIIDPLVRAMIQKYTNLLYLRVTRVIFHDTRTHTELRVVKNDINHADRMVEKFENSMLSKQDEGSCFIMSSKLIIGVRTN